MAEKEVKTDPVPEPKTDWEAEAKKAQAEAAKLKADLEKQRAATSNASSDAADWKRKYRETLDEATRKSEESAEELAGLKNQVAEYTRRDVLARNTQGYMSIGYDADSAAAMAASHETAMPDEFFSRQKAFIEGRKQAWETERLGKQPQPTPGNPVSKDKIEDAELASIRNAMFGR